MIPVVRSHFANMLGATYCFQRNVESESSKSGILSNRYWVPIQLDLKVVVSHRDLIQNSAGSYSSEIGNQEIRQNMRKTLIPCPWYVLP